MKNNQNRQPTREAETIHALSMQAQQGDPHAVEQLKEALSEDYEAYALEFYGNLARITETALVHKIAGDQLLLQEGIQRRAEEWRKELAGPCPTSLEKLLVDRIICCWLMTNYADATYAQDRGDRTWDAEEYVGKRQDRAQKRFLQACKALAQVRKLLGPNIQVNIAEKQINVAQN